MRRGRLALSYLSLAILAIATLALFLLQARSLEESAARTIGAAFDPSVVELRVTDLHRGGPAERDGLRVGDLLLRVDRHPVPDFGAYHTVAAGFRRGVPVRYEVRRGDATVEVRVLPGVPPPWGQLAVDVLVALLCLGLAGLTLAQRQGGRRVQLLAVLLALLALVLALPLGTVGHPTIGVLAWASYYLVLSATYAFGLHLAALIPVRPPWLARHRWALPLAYVATLGAGVLTTVTFVLEEYAPRRVLPWNSGALDTVVTNVMGPVWAVGTLLLLGVPALRHPDRQGRLQAALVLVGLLPQVLVALVATALDLVGGNPPLWMDTFDSLFVLAFPLAVFAAIFRYQLLDIELVVRRGLVYTVLTTLLLLVFYGLLGVGGALFSRMVESDRPSLWVASGATLILGLLFNPLRQSLERLIDRKLFPEHQAVRRRLIALAHELPALGHVGAMGEHLVTRSEEIFGVRAVTLLLADPRSGILATTASTARLLEDSGSLTLLFAPHDPGIEHLRRVARPVPTAELTARSRDLVRRFAGLDAELAVPLPSRDHLVGVLLLGGTRAGRPFRAEDLELLGFLARHVATVFENVRLFQSATYESLTGLLRREAILEVLAAELRRARRYGRPLAVAFADLDHFKSVNDRFGHLSGDAVLKRVAERLAGSLRGTDAIGRYGGEEFLLVFPETRLSDAALVAEKVRRTVEELSFSSVDGDSIDVRVSLGLAAVEPDAGGDDSSVEDLLATADRALYRAKEAGRNRVEPALAAIS